MRLIDKMLGAQPGKGHGPWSEANSGWVDPKPYVSHYGPGLFEGYDGSVWLYVEAPEDVRTEWLAEDIDAVRNQHFLVSLMKDLAKTIGGESSAKHDVRRDFHIVATQYPSGTLKPYEGCTEAHADYLARMSGQYTRPVWRAFLGIKLLPSSIFYETYGLRARARRAVEAWRNPGSVEWLLYKQDLEDVQALASNHGFRGLDFTKDVDALERLTAWYGVPDDQFDRPVQLQTQRLQEFRHGRSLITPRWGEMSFYALTPDDNVDIQDPTSARSRWGERLYHPQADVAAISIRGQVRALDSSDNLLDFRKNHNVHSDEGAQGHANSIAALIGQARSLVVEDAMPMVDNVEIVVGSVVRHKEQSEQPLVRVVRDVGMRASVLVDRQPLALLSTLPCFPRHVARVRRNNRKRAALTNVMMPAVLAYSGIFRANRPAGDRGICIGLGDVGFQFPELLIDPSGASRNNLSPTMLVTGRPGAGKTQQLTQMIAQAHYMGLPGVFLNPKSTGSLKPFFDALGGVTVSMSMAYLEQNPGLLDPTFFLPDRNAVAALLADAIQSAMRMEEDTGSASAQRRAVLTAELRERALDPRNVTSAHIIFGNPRAGTSPISDAEVRAFVQHKMGSAPFWRALISVNEQSKLTRTLRESNLLLVEWSSGMSLPDSDSARYTDDQIDTILSVTTVFRYSAQRIEGTGGMLVIDESWVLKLSREAKSLIVRAGREWRQANIMLVLGSQLIRDWASDEDESSNLKSFVSRFLLMAVSEGDEADMRSFFNITGLADTQANRQYIATAGPQRQPDGSVRPARGYLVDNVHNWSGGVLCGPWPAKELNLGRTDADSEQSRTAAQQRAISLPGAEELAGSEAW